MKTHSARALGATFALLALSVTLTACGSGSSSTGCGMNCPPPPKPEFLYASNIGAVEAFSIDITTGALGLPVGTSGPQGSAGIIADPAGKFLYVSDLYSAEVDVYSIDQTTGALTSAGSFGVGNRSAGLGGLAMDRSGKFLYAVEENTNLVAAWTIDSSTGALTWIGTVPTGATPGQAVVDPLGQFLFVSDYNDPNGGISSYFIDASTGALTPVCNCVFPIQMGTYLGPVGLAVHPNGNFLYVAMAGTQFTANPTLVAAMGIDRQGGGVFPAGQNYLFNSGPYPLLLTLDPTGNFLYVGNTAYGGISAFQVDPKHGGLTELNGSPFAVNTPAAGVTVDAQGKYLYASDPYGNTVLPFAIGSNGALSDLGPPVAAGSTPVVLSIAQLH